MDLQSLQHVIDSVRDAERPARADIEHLLSLQDDAEMQLLFEAADAVRSRYVGDGVLLRGLIEFSNVCRGTCRYCGLNRNNERLERYSLSERQILECVAEIHAHRIGTVVLQCGQDAGFDPQWLASLIERIKAAYDMAVTLSAGEYPHDIYELWKQAGADRYLLKIETVDPALYRSLHPGMSLDNRLRCLSDLFELGYQVGTGNLVGLPGQNIEHLADDILFFSRGGFGMLSISPFIPHACTPLRDFPAGDLWLTCKTLAVARIVTKNAHMPASTAVASLGGRDHRIHALRAGANVVMPNFSPSNYRPLYEIYPGKRGIALAASQSINAIRELVSRIDRKVDCGRSDCLESVSGSGVPLAQKAMNRSVCKE